MQIAVTTETVTAALRNGDPAVEKFICLVVYTVYVDPFKPYSVEADCDVYNPAKGMERHRVYLTIGREGKVYADI